MEQAVNVFNKGLQMDTNPMVQGTDTLSNALNATFVTMNGNEVMLQNDMGNRKVDNAYLPSGYEPVGIKEYGGIIYLALYNPITNRSQIGSFPSPERKIGEEVPNLRESFSLIVDDNSSTYHFTSTVIKKIKYLKEDSLLIPLTKDTSLHTGDKFSVYCGDLWSNSTKKLLTNFNNVDENTKKLLSPKNKQFTLSLGILNSQNEFVDVTNSLERWNENNKIIEFEDTDYELYKFNKGFFIANDKPEGIEIQTEDDRELIKNRLSMTANTYSYKLVGPLYLKVNYNHISSINYNISGSKTKDGDKTTAYLEVTTHIEYNCPDGLISGNGGNNIYKDFETKFPENQNFHFYPFYFLRLNENGEYEILKEDQESRIIENVNYNPDTNLYSVDIVNYYSNVYPTDDENLIIDYVIGVPSIINNDRISDDTLNSIYFIKGLSQEGKIDISKLGSGSVSLDEWRFNYNEETSTGIINYGFQAYAKIGYAFRNLQVLFIKCSDNNNVDNPNNTDSEEVKEKVGEENHGNYHWVTVEERNFTHGTYTVSNITKDYKGNNLEDKTMYNVYIKYENYSEETGVSQVIYHNTVQWFATIDIFNNDTHFNFNDISEYIVKNSKINYTFNPKISIQEYNETLIEGNLYSIDSPEDNKYIINNPIQFSTEFKNNMEVNIGKVPKNITITPSNSLMIINFPTTNNTTVDIKETDEKGNITNIDDNYQKELSLIGTQSLTPNNTITYTGKINQFMYAEKASNTKSFNIEHNFINFGDYLNKSDKSVWFTPPWIGIESYDQLISWATNASSFTIKASNDPFLESVDDYQRYDQYRFQKSSQYQTTLKTTTNYNILNNAFNSLANRNQTFIVADSQDWFKDSLGIQHKPTGKRRHCCLVWMRYRAKNDLEDKWMLACEIVLTTHNDDQQRANPRIVWKDFTDYFHGMNYYSDFSNDTETLNVYVYNENKYIFIKELQWNINLNIQYKTSLSIQDTLTEAQKRVNFYLEENELNIPIEFPIIIKSSQQKNNSGFITYITNKREEIQTGSVDYYCKDYPSINNFQSKHLYKITNGNATEVGVPNSTNMPYFPVTTEKYPDFYQMNEEEADSRSLDFKGVPVIEGFWKYKYYNKDRSN